MANQHHCFVIFEEAEPWQERSAFLNVCDQRRLKHAFPVIEAFQIIETLGTLEYGLQKTKMLLSLHTLAFE